MLGKIKIYKEMGQYKFNGPNLVVLATIKVKFMWFPEYKYRFLIVLLYKICSKLYLE